MKSDPLLKAVAWVPLEVKPFVFFPPFWSNKGRKIQKRLPIYTKR